MSTYKYDWWPSVVDIVRHYSGRKAAQIAGEQLAPQILRECEAVDRAQEIVRALPSGEDRVELIRRLYWRGKKRRIVDAIQEVHIAEATGKRWHAGFIWVVAQEIGYI